MAPVHSGSGAQGSLERRRFMAVIAGGLFTVPLAAQAQQHGKVWRIGLLDYGASNPSSDARWKGLRERLHELGYVEGQNVVFEPLWGNGQVGRLPGLAAELINAHVDIIVTAGSESAQAAKQATTSIPIVTATQARPGRAGILRV